MKKATFVLVSLLTLAAMVFALAPPVYADSPTPPRRVIPVTGNGLVSLTRSTEHQLALVDGDEVTIPAIAQRGLKAGISVESIKTLPITLPENVMFLDALSVSLVQDGKALESLPPKSSIKIYFAHDNYAKECETTFAILHWDGKAWKEVAANTLDTSVTQPGLYVLIAR